MNTQIKTKPRTKQVLSVMNILAWLAFIGLMIEASATLTTYVVTCINPDAEKYMYMKLNLSPLRKFSFWHYTFYVSCMVAFSGMKAFISYLLILILLKVNLVYPFTIKVARRLQKISYILLGAGIVCVLHNVHADWLLERTGIILEEWETGPFIFTAGLVFIISQIFRRGVELQAESDLTV